MHKSRMGCRRGAAWTCLAAWIGLALLMGSAPAPVQAQSAGTISAAGTLTDEVGHEIPITLTFPPAGGPFTGAIASQWEAGHGCTNTSDIVIQGTFSGGDGGSLNGAVSGTAGATCTDGSSITGTYSGAWTGTLNADGTGSGTWQMAGELSGNDLKVEGGLLNWQVTFSPQEFAAGVGDGPVAGAEASPEAAEPGEVTSEYIYDTYGIRVEDDGGNTPYGQTSWSEHELTLLNDVLRGLPPAMIKNLGLSRIVRGKNDIDWNTGQPDPSTFGFFMNCEGVPIPECNGETTTIRIFDRATRPYDFADDPNGDKEFKATILHEMLHAMQHYGGDNPGYNRPSELVNNYAASPLVQNWMDATRDVTDMNDPRYFSNQNGWALVNGKWRLKQTAGNSPPTKYGASSPTEDLSESVMMYVYDPAKLQASSPKRYNFIRDQVFAGVEYADGIQKNP